MSNGLGAPAPGRRMTWVLIIVVSTLEWPSRSCTVRMSIPPSRRRVAKVDSEIREFVDWGIRRIGKGNGRQAVFAWLRRAEDARPPLAWGGLVGLVRGDGPFPNARVPNPRIHGSGEIPELGPAQGMRGQNDEKAE